MPSNNRRAFLGTVSAAFVGVAGCLDDASTGATDEPTSSTPAEMTSKTTARTMETASFTLPESSVKEMGYLRVAVANPTVRKAVAYRSVMGSGGVLVSDDRQFVVAAVQSRTGKAADAEGEPRYDAFELVADGEVFPAVEIEDRTVGAYTTSLAGCGQIRYDAPYAGAHTVGWITFEPPSPLAVSGAAIRCQHDAETAEWSLSDEQISKFARPAAEFELRSFEATVGEVSVDVSFVAENVSEVVGRFLAAVYWPTAGIADDDDSTNVDRSVAAGDRIEWTKTFDTEYATGADGTVTASVEGVISVETEDDLGA